MSAYLFLRQLLDARLDEAARKWLQEASREVVDGADEQRFSALFSQASRYARDSTELAPSPEERKQAAKLLEGWDPERWGLLEAVRAALVLGRPDLEEDRGVLAFEEAFRFADEGELRALYRTLPLLPAPERFLWRAGEACRTNMRSVFEALALDNPFPVTHFDDDVFNQAVIKCVFIEAPLWRLWGLERRASEELARMALDLHDERTSAGRHIPPDLWLALGGCGGKRAVEALEAELASATSPPHGRALAAFALVRAGAAESLARRGEGEPDEDLRAAVQSAVDGASAVEYCRTHCRAN